ncbi:ECF transporter S component [Candidatus Bathyarchaeota archaeon]|nr:ECF transporter S component [Candidatus Bathyarchaeota archaeon]NIV43618.1 ECF transporter S component [Candidatus Bathyarchaeota archaeon]
MEHANPQGFGNHKSYDSLFAFSVRELAASTLLGALSIFFVFLPDVRLPWGMAALDFIAVPWIIAFLLFGLKAGFLTSVMGTLGIFFFSEELVPFIGAVMKFSASIPLVIIPAAIFGFSRFRLYDEGVKMKKVYAFSMGVAIVVRCFVTMLLNYYWAIPLMFGINPVDVPASFNWFFWGSEMNPNLLTFYVLGISLWNTWQGIIDVVVAWLVVYPTKLYKQYGIWQGPA